VTSFRTPLSRHRKAALANHYMLHLEGDLLMPTGIG
jgi:hypothetical protein